MPPFPLGGNNMENILSDINRNDTYDVQCLLEFLQDKGIIEIRNSDGLASALDDWYEEEE